MSHILEIDVSIRGDWSISRGLGVKFMEAYKETHPDVPVVSLDFAKNPPPHLDMEALSAGWVPEDQRSPEAKAKHNYRLDLIRKVKEAKTVVISTPMFNWGPPSSLKAFVDQLILPGALDPKSKGLEGVSFTILIAAGSGYSDGSGRELHDFESKYLEQVFKFLGATNVVVIRSEFGYAKFGMTDLNDAQIKSNADAIEAAIARAKSL